MHECFSYLIKIHVFSLFSIYFHIEEDVRCGLLTMYFDYFLFEKIQVSIWTNLNPLFNSQMEKYNNASNIINFTIFKRWK